MMDWNIAIEKNREALKRILAALVAMAGLPLVLRGQLTFLPQKGALPQAAALAEASKLSPTPTLPRHLHRAVLRLLRPAEAATRRLIIVAARGIVVPPPPPRSAAPSTMLRMVPLPRKRGRIQGAAGRGAGSSPAKRGRGTAEGGGGGVVEPHACAGRVPALPLLDPLHLPVRRRPRATGVPRICVPGYNAPFPLPLPPAPDDPVDAARLALRLQVLQRALDDLPAHARRFARWRAKRDAISAQNKNRDALVAQNRAPDAARKGGQHNLWPRRGVMRRISPLRLGRPPGWCRRSKHEVHEVLKDTHQLAFWALERPDTS